MTHTEFWNTVAVIASVAVLGLVGSSRAQGYDLSWHTIGGGGSASSGAQVQLVGTIGQADAGGLLNGGGFALRGGFWPGVAAGPTGPTPTPTVTATPSVDVASVRKCQAAIANSSAAFVHTKLTALQKCEAKIVAGKFTGSCPEGDPKTAQKIADSLRKLRDGIAKACGGKNKVCRVTDTGADADMPRTAIGFPAVCPGFEGSCSNAIADRDCGDIATCLGCIGGAAVDQAIALYYDGTPADPKALNACQQAIGKNAVKLFTARSKVLRSCWGKVSSGKIPGPCPDVTKAEPAIAKATSQLKAAIAKACCGKNKTCNAADSGPDADFDPVTEIGFRTSCDSVTIPGGASCDGTISDMSGLLACIDCVTHFNVGCVDAAQVPVLVMPYPAECE